MLHHYGSMSPETRPLFRVRACGIARIVRYLPYEGGLGTMMPEEYLAVGRRVLPDGLPLSVDRGDPGRRLHRHRPKQGRRRPDGIV